MNELIISFILGGFTVYVLTYRHIRFLEKEAVELRRREDFRMGYKPKEEPRFSWPWKKPVEVPEAPKKKTDETVDLLALQEQARMS